MLKNIKGFNILAELKEEQFYLPEDIKEKIKVFWNNVKLENPNLWDGELMCVSDFKIDNGKLSIICKKSNYSHYLYDERMVLPKKYGCSSLAGCCLLETSDNYYIVGELGEKGSFPYCMQISGGSVDKKDVKDGNINILNTIFRETKEELNINLQDDKIVENFEIKYIKLPSENVHNYCIFAKAKLKIDSNKMQKHYDEYLQYLQNNKLEIEFGKIHFIKKGETTKELGKFSNPKRNYLEELLKIDSAE